MPVISLCVIVYNLEKYIGACLDSILTQGFQDYELIVVDNGSTDNSITICEEYARNYKERISYFKLPLPSVPARGHSFAVEQAIGEYVHVIDGDDCVAENYLNEVYQVIIEQQPDLIMGRFECIVEEGASNYLDVSIDANMINGKDVNEAIEYIFNLPYFNRYVWRFITKRSLLSFSKFEDRVSHLVIADNIKSSVWLMRAKIIYFIEKPFYYYRRRLGSTVSSVNNKMTQDYIKGIFEISKIISAFEMPTQIEYFAHLQSKQMLWYLKLFYSGYRYLEASDIVLLAEYIEENRSLWRFLKVYQIDELNDWISKIEQHGAQRGLALYKQEIDHHFLSKVKEIARGDVLIFPAGKYAESTCELLTDAGFKVSAFLDNDQRKTNQLFNNKPCYMPEWLTSNNYSKSNLTVVISTLYKDLEYEFIHKVIQFGIDKDRIIIR